MLVSKPIYSRSILIFCSVGLIIEVPLSYLLAEINSNLAEYSWLEYTMLPQLVPLDKNTQILYRAGLRDCGALGKVNWVNS